MNTAPIIYEPEDKTAKLPAPPLCCQDCSSKYDYVYNYKHFVDMLNTPLKTMFMNLKWIDTYTNKRISPVCDCCTLLRLRTAH